VDTVSPLARIATKHPFKHIFVARRMAAGNWLRIVFW
jgi:hypothetical protein